MGGHGHHKIEIPDYKIYKVEDVPELMKVQEKLAAKGLKDPWLRNEVWRYHKDLTGGMSIRQRASQLIFRGFKPGFCLFVATVVGEIAYKMMNKGGKTPPSGPSHTSYGETPPSVVLQTSNGETPPSGLSHTSYGETPPSGLSQTSNGETLPSGPSHNSYGETPTSGLSQTSNGETPPSGPSETSYGETPPSGPLETSNGLTPPLGTSDNISYENAFGGIENEALDGNGSEEQYISSKSSQDDPLGSDFY